MDRIRLRRLTVFLALLIVVAAILIGTGWFAAQFAAQNALPRSLVITADLRITRTPRVPITPIAPFGPVDPAIIQALQGTPGGKPFGILPGIPPIGVYLPGIPTHTPAPTATRTATPTPSLTRTGTSTRTATITDTALPTGTARPTRTKGPTSPAITVIVPPLITRTPIPSLTPTETLTLTPSVTPTVTPVPPLPTPSPYPPDPNIDDYGVIQLQNLFMTPNPTLVGENCAPHGLPVEGILTQHFHRYHTGADLGVPSGTPVRATHSGQVIFAGWSLIGYGWLVIIQNDHFITYYAHNSAFNVSPYQYVHAGDVIAYSGSTGNSSGPHVHYEIRIDDVAVDPLTFDERGLRAC